MTRKKEFGTDEALHKAMRAFWTRGYEATSLQNLVDCMGINRGSLYATFSDKHTLFIGTLYRYEELYQKAHIAKMAKSRSPRRGIIRVFEETLHAIVVKGKRDGCFLINTALELSPHDQEAAAVVSNAFARQEAFFRTMIERSQARGEIARAVVPVETARTLLSLFIGMQVLSRSRPEKTLLRSIVNQAKALLPRGNEKASPHRKLRAHR